MFKALFRVVNFELIVIIVESNYSINSFNYSGEIYVRN